MEKKFGFSLAEALVTMLIVSIIAIVSAPAITQKAKKIDNKTVWSINTDDYATITPTAGRDLKLGKTRNGKTQGIVVVNRLEFKNRKGEVIGWINEDGTSSFSGVSNEALQEELRTLISELTKDMHNMIQSNQTQYKRKETQLETINKTEHDTTMLNNQINVNKQQNLEQIKEIEKLTEEIFKLMDISKR